MGELLKMTRPPESPSAPTVLQTSNASPLGDVRVVFEDAWLLIVFKPAGVAVHADHENSKTSGRFQHLDLQSHLEKELKKELTLYHRLDRDTTGLVIFGKDPRVNAAMTAIFEKKQVRKSYMAVVKGRWLPQWNRVENILRKESDRWSNQNELPGKTALTTFRLLAASDEKSWIEAIPKTGRTHQIRLHCLERGCPILGDRLYNSDFMNLVTPDKIQPAAAQLVSAAPPQALHAYRLDFKHPMTSSPMRVTAPPPKYWTSIWLNGLGDPVTIERTWNRFFTEA